MPQTTTAASRSLEAELVAELEAVYQETEDTFLGWTCPASTECCRFGITGREPYVTSIELAAIRRAIAARGGPRALQALVRAEARRANEPAARSVVLQGRRALAQLPERRCPMLTDAGRCAIYASRPLGCRTYYCDRASAAAPVRHHDVTRLVRKVQDIAARHEPGGDLGRPLTRALAEPPPRAGGGPPPKAGSPAARSRRGR